MGTITGTSIFEDTSSNSGTVTNAQFVDSAVNAGTILNNATFTETSKNTGTVVGNATFTDSASCVSGSTINGAVIFSGNAVNYATLTEAIFTGSAVNNGTVTTATFAGTTVNNGTVTNGTFAESTTTNAGTVTNATVATGVTNSGTFTNSQSFTQTGGAFSYGYFVAGVKTAPPNYSTLAYQVNSVWYTYDVNGNASLANGEYSDGTNLSVFKNGVKLNVGTITLATVQYYYELPLVQGSILYTNNTLTTKAGSGNGAGLDIDGNLEEDDWIIAAGGAVSWGDIPRYGAYIDGYYSNDTIVTGYTNTTPQTARNSLGAWYVYASGIGSTANGSYSNGYYIFSNKTGTFTTPQSAKDQEGGWYLYTGGVAASADGAYTTGYFEDGIKTTSTIYTPQTAINDSSKYYVYNSGVTSLASGAYSIGYYAAGVKDTDYNNAIPATPQDSAFYYVYSSGTATLGDGLYSNVGLSNGSVLNNLNSTTPQQAQNDSKWYLYTSGFVTVTAEGVYTTGYFENGVKSTTYTNTTPQTALNDSTKYYVYAGGVASLASGAYSNGYFVSGEFNGTYNTPLSAKNAVGQYYIYSGGIATAAQGAYSNGYFDNGVIDPNYSSANGTPEDDAQDDSLWYVYTTGNALTASGAYSNGYYAYGSIDTYYSSVDGIPEDSAQDDNFWYVYTNGSPTIAEGAYTNGYFSVGVKSGTYTLPQTAQNNANLYYVYSSGNSLTASGVYSNGFFNYGDLDETYTNSLPQSGKDSGIWYVFTNGAQTSASGLYSNYAFNSNGSINTGYTYAIPQSALNDNLWYTYNAGVATTAISSIDLNNVTYYHIGTLNNGVSKLYSNSAVTNLVISTSGIDDVTGDLVDERWRTDSLGKFYWGIPKSLNGITYYYEGPLVQNTTVFYSNSGLTTLAINLSGSSDDLNNDSVNDVWTINGSGVISWSKELVLGGTTYYYSGELYNGRSNSGTTVIYTNSSLTTPASGLTGFDRVQYLQNPPQEDIYNYWETNSAGIIFWYESTKITSEGTDYFYTRDATSPYSPLNGYTILYTDSGLSSVVVSLTGNSYLTSSQYTDNWSTDSNGVLSWIDDVVLQGYTFYYQGRLVGGNAPLVLYLNNDLTNYAGAYTNYTGVDDFDGDGKRERITIDNYGYAITNSVFELSSYSSGFWVEDPIINGVTPVWSNNTLTTSYNSGAVTQFTVIALSGSAYSLVIRPGSNILHFTPLESITDIFTNNTYAISKTLSSDSSNFVLSPNIANVYSILWSSNTFNTSVIGTAVSGISYLNSESKNIKWVWNGGTFDQLDFINPLAVDGGTYYYTGTLTSGTTILYLTPALSSLAANLSGTNDIYTEDPPDSYAEEYWHTNQSGLLSWEGVNTTLTNSVTTVYFLGTMTNQGTTIFQDSNLNQPLANSSGTIDLSGSTYNFTTNANGVITYVQSSSFTIRGITYYYETGAGFNNGSLIIYTNNSLTTPAANLNVYQDSSWGPSNGENAAIITTNGSGVISWNTSVGGPIDWEGDAEDYYYAGTLTSGTTNVYKGSDGAIAGNTSGIDTGLPGGSGNDYVTVTNGVISWSAITTLSLNGITYYHTGTLTNGVTVLYTDDTLDTLAASLTWTVAQDLDADNETDTWETNASGVISWTPVSSINIGGTLYYYEGTLTSGTTIIYSNDTLATPAINLSGINDIDGGGNDAWSTDGTGVITWAPYVAPETVVLDGVTYYYAGGTSLTSGTTELYTDDVLATAAANISGVDTISGTNSSYSTDGSGVITWVTVNTQTLGSTPYYYTGTLTSGTTVLYTDDQLVYLATGLSGTHDIDGGGDDDWSTNGSGVITWAPAAVPNTLVLNSTTYYYDANDSLIVGTVLYTEDTLTATAGNLTGVASGTYYATDGSGVLTNVDAVNSISLDSTTYYHTGSLTSATTVLYTDSDLATLATSVSGPSPANQDLNSDGNNDSWSTNSSGVISWSMEIVYANDWSALGGTYYSADSSLTNGTSVLYSGQGSGASLASNQSGTYDFGGGSTSWSTDGSGVISWT